jgi:hypothetical protein
MKKPQQGITTVEFALIASLAMIVLFGVIEVARALFVWNTLVEATRRGARVAVVCSVNVNSSAIKRAAVFGKPDGGNDGNNSPLDSPVLHGLSTDNVTITYLDESGVPIDVSAGIKKVFDDIAYVQVGIDYQHTLFIPFVDQQDLNLNAPSFSTTLPVESLGYGAEC